MRSLPLAALLALLGACGLSSKMLYSAPPQSVLMGGVSVQFQSAVARSHQLRVELVFTNLSGAPMLVGRDGIGLRLPDGRMLTREGASHAPILVPPSASVPVVVDFRDRQIDLRKVQVASVVVGGISYT